MMAHYPKEFMAALMSNEMGDSDEIVMLINECRKMGVTVLPPDVNKSETTFLVEGDAIRFGLCAIKNVGQGAVESIIKARNQNGTFKGIYDISAYTVFDDNTAGRAATQANGRKRPCKTSPH